MKIETLKVYILANKFPFMRAIDEKIKARFGKPLPVQRFINVFLCTILNRKDKLNKETCIDKQLVQPPIQTVENICLDSFGWSCFEEGRELSYFMSTFNDDINDTYCLQIINDKLVVYIR